MQSLKTFFSKYDHVVVALSGGVDSSFLLKEASLHAKKVLAVCVHSAFQPDFEIETAKKIAADCKVPLIVLTLDVLVNEAIRKNPWNRCYYCKKAIFTQILSVAKEHNIPYVVEGTNASDDLSDRPGYQALQELGVLSPLLTCGITKDEIRNASKAHGLTTADTPSYACLATRIPTDYPISKEALEAVAQCEKLLMQEGYRDFRIRYRIETDETGAAHSYGLLQVTLAQYDMASANLQHLISLCKPYLSSLRLDEKTR